MDLTDGSWYLDAKILSDRLPKAPLVELDGDGQLVLFPALASAGGFQVSSDGPESAELSVGTCVLKSKDSILSQAMLLSRLPSVVLIQPATSPKKQVTYQVRTPSEPSVRRVELNELFNAVLESVAVASAPVDALAMKTELGSDVAQHFFGATRPFVVDEWKFPDLLDTGGEALVAKAEELNQVWGPAEVLGPVFTGLDEVSVRLFAVKPLQRFGVSFEVRLTDRRQVDEVTWSAQVQVVKVRGVSKMPALP